MKNNLKNFVNGGGSIYASDRAYEILRVIFGGTLNFVGNEGDWHGTLANGWVGVQDWSVPADISDGTLAAVVGTSSVDLIYDKDQWVPLDVTQPSNVVSWSFNDAPTGNPGGTDGAVFACFGTHMLALYRAQLARL